MTQQITLSETQKSSSVNLYKYTSRQEAVASRPSQSNLLVRVCECALPHVETIWLEDTPSQVIKSDTVMGLLYSWLS